MKRRIWAWMLGAVLCACGAPGGGLPTGPDEPDANGGGGGDGGGNTHTPSEVAKSTWPLTTGSTWKYRITDPLKGSFDKDVEVLGEMPIPGRGDAKAVAVRSAQPHLEELSWQVVTNGVVIRVREEDRKLGTLVRVMQWDPATMKALDLAQDAGWTREETVREIEQDGAGNVVDEKEKVFVWQVEAVNQQVTVPAGTFDNAIKLRRIRTDKEDWERVYWLVPGVGKVLEEGERREELLQYDVRPSA